MRNRTVVSEIVRKIGSTMIIIAGVIPGFAQTGVIQSKQDAVVNMATSQYWGLNNDSDTAKTSKTKAASAAVNTPTAYNISGEDKYIKTPEAGKRYEEFQVFDINGMNKNDVAVGLLTNTLDRATRYDEKGDVANKVHVATGTVGELNEKGTALAHGVDAKTPVAAISFHDKYFLIIGKDDYRYVDGKKLVGNQKVVDALVKGKPITEITFFYELQKAGIVGKNVTVTQFTKMSASQKQRMLNNGIMAGNL